MTFTNSTDLFQRKLINYEIKNVTLDTSLSVWESDKNDFAWVTQNFC